MMRLEIDMVNESMLQNAFDIALEEVIDPEDISKDDLKSFKKRFDGLVDKLEDECETDKSDDDDSDN
jgi:hypothetical protein